MKKESKKPFEQEYRCLKCNKYLNAQEIRVFLEGRYGIDPNGDDRQLCEGCKNAKSESSS